jgi:hypothetical protein
MRGRGHYIAAGFERQFSHKLLAPKMGAVARINFDLAQRVSVRIFAPNKVGR